MIVLVAGYNLHGWKSHYGIHPNDVIVYMPYTDLHPSEQSANARAFVGKMSKIKNDNMVYIVTHSDHVLNGIRLAVALDNIPPPTIWFYDKDGNKAVLTMDEYGGPNNWPVGFFSQIETDLCLLVKSNTAKRKKNDR